MMRMKRRSTDITNLIFTAHPVRTVFTSITGAIFLLLLSFASTVAVHADAPDCSGYPAAYSGTGASGDPYQISDLSGLQCMSANLSGYYVLTDNIDAFDTSTWNAGAGFEPIGPSGSTPFKGGFDGDNHIVSNLYINRPTSNAGLFGTMDFNTKYIRNIGLKDVNIAGGTNAGGLAGVLDTQEPVENVFVTGSVTGGWTGGLASANWTNIQNCYTDVTVHGGNWTVGGFVAVNYGGNISDSYVNGDVIGGTASRIGAFLARNENGTITNSFYNSSSLTLGVGACPSSTEPAFGGCLGQSMTGKTATEMQDVATFTNLSSTGLSSAWDFVGNPNDDAELYNFWTIDAGHSPSLASFLGLADQDGDGHNMMNDCDDTNEDVFEIATYYIDEDGDSFGTPSVTTEACGVPSGYAINSEDCDDTNVTIFPRTFYSDDDSDSYGDPAVTTSVCGGPTTEAPAGFVNNGTDCDDDNEDVFHVTNFYPDSDGDGFGIPTPLHPVCGGLTPTAPSGYAVTYGDCDDENHDLYPGSFDGSGTVSDPYIIKTLDELSCINGTTATLAAYYLLGNDIEASETETMNDGLGFAPIGPDRNAPFRGAFDGMGHVIRNLHINRPTTSHVGLFGYTDFNTKHIRNLGLEDIDFKGYYVGGLASTLSTQEPVENVYVTGLISGSRSGGLASINWADIENCYTEVTVTSTGNWMAGGFVMENHGGNISNVYVNGDVTGNATRIGAFLSFNDGTINNSFYNADALTLSIGACPSTDESGFGGCDNQEITAKSDVELGLVETFTDLVTQGLTAAWDFVGTFNDDYDIHDLWEMTTHPLLAIFTGNVDQDGDGHKKSEDCNDDNASVFQIETYFSDFDGDNFGGTSATIEACGVPVGYSVNVEDCDDNDFSVYPRPFFIDSDGDNYGDLNISTTVCGGPITTPPLGFVNNGTDCDDDNEDVFHVTNFYPDSDGDGFGIPTPLHPVCGGLTPTAPSGYAVTYGDCDDENHDLYPGSFDGSGTVSDPYIIKTLDELSCINGTTATLAAYYLLGNDIEASETETMNDGLGFAPIGPDRNAPFRGAFDGMGHVIRNLHINRPTTSHVGLFGYTDFNTKHIRNLGLEDVDIIGGIATGGLAGLLMTNSATPVENVYVTGAVSGKRAGGLAEINWADIRNCYTDVTVTALGNWMTAGFVAENYGGDISNSYVNGDVIGNSSRIGAFLARNDNGTVSNSFYNVDNLSLEIGACPSTEEATFARCSGLGITAKSDDQFGQIETFTDISTVGLSSPWDFLNNPNDDIGIRNLWEMAIKPVLSVFSGLGDQDSDGFNFVNDCNDQDSGAHVETLFYRDHDGDGYGSMNEAVSACGLANAPNGYVVTNTDCDDGNVNIRPRTFFRDSDGDTRGDSNMTTMICGGSTTIAPEGYVIDSTDCDDANTDIFKVTIFYPDGDDDGFGISAPTYPFCGGAEPAVPVGYAALSGDCDDENHDLYPGSFDGSGTVSDPYIIKTLDELACINGTTATLTAYYELGNDIDASETINWNGGLGFSPIGADRKSPFQGALEGRGHIIHNLFINRPTTDNVGLFGYMDFNAKYIRNIGLENINITGGTYTGGLAGVLNATGGPVENVYVTGSVSGKRAGGLAETNWADIHNCYTDVTVTALGNWMTAGFVAENYRGDIVNSYSNGDVLGNSSRIGAFLSKNDSGTITDSFYNMDSLTLDIGACPSTTEPGFGGCGGQGITGKTAEDFGLVETFTDLITQGLAVAWDFLGNPNNDGGIHNYWKMATHPILSIFSGQADQDGDGYDFSHDCNDRDPDAHDIASQYADTDIDGYGNPAVTIQSCGAPVGYVSNDDDCNDADKKIFLVTFFADMDGDGYGVDTPTTQVCGGTETLPPSGYASKIGDCDDNNFSVFPLQYYQDLDLDGYGSTATERNICDEAIPEGYVLLSGDGNDTDASINPGAVANITIGTNIIASDIEPLGADMSLVAGGTNLFTNNMVWGSGFEPGVIREFQRVQRTGIQNNHRWLEWDYNGGVSGWDTRATGFFNGATVRFYRLVDADGNPIPYVDGVHDTTSADHVVFLGEASVPLPNDELPKGGFISEEGATGMKRMYVDQPFDLSYGDYAFIYMKKMYVSNDVVTSRLQRYWNPDHPGFDFLWGAKGRLVEHPGPIPESFVSEEPGQSCVRLEATEAGPITAGQWVYYKSSAKDLWYSQLHPGARYRVEAWLRQDGLGDDGNVRSAFHSASNQYASANQIEPWKVTGEWKKFIYDFIGPDYPTDAAFFAHTLKFTGPGNLYIDNWVIYRNDEKHGFEPFSPQENSIDPILASIPVRGKKPTVRFYQLEYNNASIEAMTSEHGDSSFSGNSGQMGSFTGATYPQSIRWAYATGDTPDTRVVPWLTIPEEYTEVEYKALIEYLGVPYDPATDTSESKPYAYKRYVQRDGNGTPWTSEFREILVEYGNETWHQGLGGYGWNGFNEPGRINYGGKEYGMFAQYIFGKEVKGMADWKKYDLDSKIKIVLGANYSATKNSETAYGEIAAQNTDAISYIGHANYVGPKWETGDVGAKSFNDHGVQETLVGPLVNSTVLPLISTASTTRDALLAAGKADYRIVSYEGGPSGYWSNPSNPDIDEEYGKSLAMGVAALDTWLYSSQKGYGYQNYHAFQTGKWWTSHTPPEQGGLRAQPGWLALMLRNRFATGMDMVSASVNTAPTYLRNGTLLPLISSYAMRDGQGNYSVFVLSRKLDGTHDGTTFGDGFSPVTLHLPFGSAPTKISLHKLAKPDGTPADPRDNNLLEDNVSIVSQDINLENYSTDFVIDENTGGGANGMPPGTAYLYTFSFCDGTTTCVDADADGYYATDDCDDSDATVHSMNTFYADPDDDGYGLFDSSIRSCTKNPPSGYAEKSGDCAPTDATAFDSASPYYRDADGDGYGFGNPVGERCGAPAGYSIRIGDCDDSDASVNPGVAGSCDTSSDDGSDGNASDGDGHRPGNKSHKKSIVDEVASWISGLGNGGDSQGGGSGSGSEENSSTTDEGQMLQTALDTAAESPDVAVPTITGIIPFPEDGIIRFLGTGTPDSDIVLVVHSEAILVKQIRVDGNGFWRYDHFQKDVFLEPGSHEAYVVAFDAGKKLKSAPSGTRGFEVASSDAGVSRRFAFDWEIIAVIIGILAIAGGAFLFSKRRVKGA